jgi:hypothetical protein
MKRRNFIMTFGYATAGTTFSYALAEIPSYEPNTKMAGNLDIFVDRNISTEVSVIADSFNKHHPDINVTIEASMVGGTLSDGPRTLRNPLYLASEKIDDGLLVNLGIDPEKMLEIPVFTWAVFIIASNKNIIKSVDMKSLSKVFFAEDVLQITWGSLGGASGTLRHDEPVSLHGMSDMSRFTRLFQKKVATKSNLSPRVIKYRGANDLLQVVASTDNAIGFCGRASVDTKALGIINDGVVVEAIGDTNKNCLSESYPLSAISMLYSMDIKSNEIQKEFCKFLLSKQGLKSLDALEFVHPISDDMLFAANRVLHKHINK